MQTQAVHCIADELRMLEQMLNTEKNQKTSMFMREFLRSQTKFFETVEVERVPSGVLAPQFGYSDD